MPGFVEIRRKITEFVDRWDPKISLAVLLLLGAAGYLEHKGSEWGDISKQTAEYGEEACLAAGVLVGTLQISSWSQRKFAKRHTFEPKTSLPDRDELEPGLVFTSRNLFGFPKFRFFIPDETQLEWFVEWSEGDSTIRDANEHFETYQRRLLYSTWYRANPNHFLVMQSKATVGANWSTVALSIILDLPTKSINALRNQSLAVIDLHKEHFSFDSDERKGANLLYDTLILEKTFRKQISDFKTWHSLFHFALFPVPTAEAKVSLFIEPDNDDLKRSFKDKRKYGPYIVSTLVSGHEIFEFVLPNEPESSIRPKRTVEQWRSLRERGFVIPVGC
jgi:hypothetical protein